MILHWQHLVVKTPPTSRRRGFSVSQHSATTHWRSSTITLWYILKNKTLALKISIKLISSNKLFFHCQPVSGMLYQNNCKNLSGWLNFICYLTFTPLSTHFAIFGDVIYMLLLSVTSLLWAKYLFTTYMHKILCMSMLCVRMHVLGIPFVNIGYT